MTIKEQIADVAKRAQAALSMAQTEEATKNAVIMPFLRALGFDVFDPAQVIPEFTADVGIKKGEKVDYAIAFDGKIQYLVEAKSINQKLSDAQNSQLYRYFSVTEASIAILTNGVEYWFFTDIDEKNKMDPVPFFKFDILGHDESDIREIEKFQRDRYNYEAVRSTASSLKYTKSAINVIEKFWQEPDDEFIKIVVKNFYDGQIRSSVIDAMRPIVKRAFDELIRQRIRQKLQFAFEPPEPPVSSDVAPIDDDTDANDRDIITTEEEIMGFNIIRAIASKFGDVSRIVLRDQKSYCGVLFDDNNRKPIVRMHFNSRKKFIQVFDQDKNPHRFDITRLEDIYSHASAIENVIGFYLSAEQEAVA